MRRRRSKRAVLAWALALTAMFATSACGGEEHAEGEPLREGLDVKVDGVDFNVFITRQLNLRDPEDRAYYSGPDAPAGSELYGVFLEACNRGKGPAQAAAEFKIVDTQGEEFEPIELPPENVFGYSPRQLEAGECIPEAGSIPAASPTAGSLLLFRLPLDATENRPLELEIEGGLAEGKRSIGKVELDI